MSLRRQRREALKKLGPSAEVSGWAGLVFEVGENLDGHATLIVTLNESTDIATWNIAMSECFSVFKPGAHQSSLSRALIADRP